MGLNRNDCFIFLSFYLCVVVLADSSFAAEKNQRAKDLGKRLAQKVYDRPDGDTAFSHLEMKIIKKGSKPRIREFYSYVKEPAPGSVKSLIRFMKPAEAKDTVILTIDKPNTDDSDQKIFLPALKRSRQVSSSRKGGNFVGSDYIYEDLRDRELSEDKYKLLGKEVVNGLKTQVLLSAPVKPDSSVYGRVVSWIHSDSLIPLRVVFYDKNSKKIKQLDVQEIKKIQNIWTVTRSTMKDLKTGSSTEINLKEIKYNKEIPDSYFTKRYLENPDLIK